MPKRKQMDVSAEADMTPMIDMTFQLIAFFMVLINFAEDNQDQRVKLPSSELAKVPEQALQLPIVLQMTRDGKVLFNGDELIVTGKEMNTALRQEAAVLKAKGLKPNAAHVIIRAHGLSQMGDVQNLIAVCQKNEFERFSLRAEQGKPKMDAQLRNKNDK
jgi:biopolymer transport protein ExbD